MHSIPPGEAFRVSQTKQYNISPSTLKNTEIHKSADTLLNAVLQSLRTRLAASRELTDQPAVT